MSLKKGFFFVFRNLSGTMASRYASRLRGSNECPLRHGVTQQALGEPDGFNDVTQSGDFTSLQKVCKRQRKCTKACKPYFIGLFCLCLQKWRSFLENKKVKIFRKRGGMRWNLVRSRDCSCEVCIRNLWWYKQANKNLLSS